mmetsp:Transcript_81522/g.230795  ORF Transcript_81522/g.230795 Transcript_81522/m.230795 type:complete len:308 (+) Transcript_81522:118-1041(+)
MSKTSANIGTAVSLIVALFWLLAIFAPWNWLSSENGVVKFRVNLIQIDISKGTVGYIADATVRIFYSKAGAGLNEYFDKSFWIEEGVGLMCSEGLELIWHWCDQWVMVKIASFLMIGGGIMTSAWLVVGAVCMYYYVHEKSTRTGRQFMVGALIAAPAIATASTGMYMLLTMQFGGAERKFVNTNSMYGPGVFGVIFMTLMSFVPLYVKLVHFKKDHLEGLKNEDFLDSMATNEQYGQQYGGQYADQYGAQYAPQYAAQPPPGYGASGGGQAPPGYGAASGLHPTSAFGVPQAGPQPQPGFSNRPAW